MRSAVPAGLVCLIVAGCRTTAPAPVAGHVGPVTGVIVAGGEVLSCSQAGVKTGRGWIQPRFRATCIAMHGDRLLIGGGDPAERGDLALFARARQDAFAREPVAKCRVSDDLVYALAIHPDGTRAAIGCADGTVRLLSLPGLEDVRELARHTAPCLTLAFSADGETLATGSRDGLVYLHDLTEGTRRTIKDHTAGIECLLFAGRRLYSGARDGKVRIHDDAALVRTYLGMRQPVHGLASVNGRVVAGLRDGRIVRLHPDDATHAEVLDVRGPLFSMIYGNGALLVGVVGACRRLECQFE